MTSSNAQAYNNKYIFLNNLGRKHSLLMKFGQIMSYDKGKKIIKQGTMATTVQSSKQLNF